MKDIEKFISKNAIILIILTIILIMILNYYLTKEDLIPSLGISSSSTCISLCSCLICCFMLMNMF